MLARDSDTLIPTLRESIEYAITKIKSSDIGSDIKGRIAELQANMLKLLETSVGTDPAERDAKFKALADEIGALQNQLSEQGSNQADMEKRRSRINEMIGILERRDYCLEEYDDRLVRQMVEQVRVVDEDTVTVSFGVGAEYTCGLRDSADK